MQKRYLVISLGIAFTALIIIGSCSKSKDTTNTPPVTSGNNVSIINFKFSSADIHVTSGSTVTWKNNDSSPHTVTADDNSFTSPTLNTGDTYSKTFATAGTYPYHCSIHPMMKADVVVAQ
jgi:amicyanin